MAKGTRKERLLEELKKYKWFSKVYCVEKNIQEALQKVREIELELKKLEGEGKDV